MSTLATTDQTLLDASRRGDVEAFRSLVERYQSLVCSVSYSATGDWALSEDVAQETFVAAWRGLAELRESSKLRGWLCGIARNLSAKSLRRGGREIPSPDDTLNALQAGDSMASPLDTALTRESDALVWSTLSELPEVYRECMILYYREDRSVRQVASTLGLSEEAVLQRLSRGRQNLKASIAGLVEQTLVRTKPTKAFSTGVVVAIGAGAAGTTQAASATQAAGSGGSSVPLIPGGLVIAKFVKLGAVVLVLILAGLGGSTLFASDTDATEEAGSTPTIGEPHAVKGPPKREPTRSGIPMPSRWSASAPSSEASSAPSSEPGAMQGEASAAHASVEPKFEAREYKNELRRELTTAEVLWNECLESLGEDRSLQDGIVRVNFMIADKEGQGADAWQEPGALVESMDVDYDETTVTNAEVLECIRTTPQSMTFHSPPDDLAAALFGFQVVIEGGVVAGASGLEMSFLRESDVPYSNQE